MPQVEQAAVSINNLQYFTAIPWSGEGFLLKKKVHEVILAGGVSQNSDLYIPEVNSK